MHHILEGILLMIVGAVIAYIGFGLASYFGFMSGWMSILLFPFALLGLFGWILFITGIFTLFHQEEIPLEPGVYSEVRCPYCGATLRRSGMLYYSEVQCSFCGRRFRVK